VRREALQKDFSTSVTGNSKKWHLIMA